MTELFNSTNITYDGAINVTLSGNACCTDVWIPIFTTIIIVGFFLLFLYMAESRKDIGYTFFMLGLSAMAFNDAILSSVAGASIAGATANLPLLMVFISVYEVIMTFLLMRELGQREREVKK